MADETGRHRVKHLPQRKAARRGNSDDGLLMIGGSMSGQTLQNRPLGLSSSHFDLTHTS
jgi:hypothetical protein